MHVGLGLMDHDLTTLVINNLLPSHVIPLLQKSSHSKSNYAGDLLKTNYNLVDLRIYMYR